MPVFKATVRVGAPKRHVEERRLNDFVANRSDCLVYGDPYARNGPSDRRIEGENNADRHEQIIERIGRPHKFLACFDKT